MVNRTAKVEIDTQPDIFSTYENWRIDKESEENVSEVVPQSQPRIYADQHRSGEGKYKDGLLVSFF
jgi:hypothetical protein